MPNIASAKKALRQADRRKVRNSTRRSVVHDIAKEIRQLVKSGKKSEAEKLISKAYKLFDKAAKRGVVKPRAASRHKSRLMKLVHRG